MSQRLAHEVCIGVSSEFLIWCKIAFRLYLCCRGGIAIMRLTIRGGPRERGKASYLSLEGKAELFYRK